MMGSVKNHPEPVGASLNASEIEKVARLVYQRFHYEYGTRPQWVDSAAVRQMKREEVKRVIDSLELSGYSIIKKEG